MIITIVYCKIVIGVVIQQRLCAAPGHACM